jgi:hypothetical protein
MKKITLSILAFIITAFAAENSFFDDTPAPKKTEEKAKTKTFVQKSATEDFFDDTPPKEVKVKSKLVIDFDKIGEEQKKDSVKKYIARHKADSIAAVERERDRPAREERERQARIKQEQEDLEIAQRRRKEIQSEDAKLKCIAALNSGQIGGEDYQRCKKNPDMLNNSEKVEVNLMASFVTGFNSGMSQTQKDIQDNNKFMDNVYKIQREQKEQRESIEKAKRESEASRIADAEERQRKWNEDSRKTREENAAKQAEQKRVDDAQAKQKSADAEKQRLADEQKRKAEQQAEAKRFAQETARADEERRKRQKEQEYERTRTQMIQRKKESVRVGAYSCPGYSKMAWATVQDFPGESDHKIYGVNVTVKVTCPGGYSENYVVDNVVGNGSCLMGSQAEIRKDFPCKVSEMRTSVVSMDLK